MSSLQNPPSVSPTTQSKGLVSQAAYDEVPYGSFPVASSHPDCLYTMASLFGLNPVLPDRARILEIGCAGGGNIIPLASLLPNSTCVGIELSPVQCEYGNKSIAFSGMKNVRIHQGSITDVTPDFGKFDYILCHGVYSWVPDFVREAILRVASENLSDDGVAFISYNTLPGWHLRGMVRSLMLEHVRDIEDPIQRVNQARAILKFLVDATKNSNEAHAIYMHFEHEMLSKVSDNYLLHDHLEDTNHPVYFRDFIRSASKYDLQFLGEASMASTWSGNLSAEAQKGLAPLVDAVEKGHYMDCISSRKFRETYLVKKHAAINRSLDLASAEKLRFFGRFEPPKALDPNNEKRMTFQSASGTSVQTDSPACSEMIKLMSAVYPQSLSLEEIVTKLKAKGAIPSTLVNPKKDIASILIEGMLRGWVEFRGLPDRLKASGYTKPKATVWSRCQAQAAGYVTNLRHEFVSINEVERQILPLLDGNADMAMLSMSIEVLVRTGLIKLKTADGEVDVNNTVLMKTVTKQLVAGLANKSLVLADS